MVESELKIKNKIRKLWRRVSPENKKAGAEWYEDANNWLWDVVPKINADYRTIAAVCAILSPNVKWKNNKTQTENLIHAYQLTKSIEGVVLTTYKNQIKKALKILDNQDDIAGYEKIIGRRAFKTVAFYRNISSRSWQHVTIDTHMFNALQIKQVSSNKSQYRTIESAFIEVATELHTSGYKLQAAIWLQHKENKNTAPF